MAGITFLIVALIVAFTWVTKVSAGTISTSAVSLNDAILIDVSRQVVHQLRHPKGRSYRWISNGSDVGQGNSTRRAQYASELKQVTKKHTNNQRSPSPPPTVTQHPLTSQRDHEQNPLKTADDDYNSWMKPSPAVQHQNDGKPTTSIFVVIPLIISMITFIVGVFMAIYALHRCGQVALRTHRGGGRRRNQAATASNGSDAPEERQRGEVAKDARIRYILNHLEITSYKPASHQMDVPIEGQQSNIWSLLGGNKVSVAKVNGTATFPSEKAPPITSATTPDGLDEGCSHEAPSCTICLKDYESGESMATSKNPDCVHAFHQKCIMEWLMEHDDCPCCRKSYFLINGENADKE